MIPPAQMGLDKLELSALRHALAAHSQRGVGPLHGLESFALERRIAAIRESLVRARNLHDPGALAAHYRLQGQLEALEEVAQFPVVTAILDEVKRREGTR